MTIIVGLASDPQAIVRRASELGLKAATARWLTVGVLEAGAVDEWVGIEPVADAVNLCAPEPHEGDVPGTWLRFERAPWVANTSDLAALRAEP